MIRSVRNDDATAIAHIYNGYISHSVASFETRTLSPGEMALRIGQIAAQYPYLVFEQKGIVAGYAYAHPWKERAAYHITWETTVYVHPAHLHQGIGEQLMRHLVDDCRKAGCHALIACITGGNTASCRLHEKIGFRQVSLFREVGEKFGALLDVVDYELLL